MAAVGIGFAVAGVIEILGGFGITGASAAGTAVTGGAAAPTLGGALAVSIPLVIEGVATAQAGVVVVATSLKGLIGDIREFEYYDKIVCDGSGSGNPGTKGSGNKDFSKATKAAEEIRNKAKAGTMKKSSNYHGRLDKAKELEILSEPDAIYVANNNSENLIFRKGENVVIVESKGSSKGNVITSYGPDGPRGTSGQAIYGGSVNDPGLPITHDAIINGKIPTPSGETIPPASQIYP